MACSVAYTLEDARAADEDDSAGGNGKGYQAWNCLGPTPCAPFFLSLINQSVQFIDLLFAHR